MIDYDFENRPLYANENQANMFSIREKYRIAKTAENFIRFDFFNFFNRFGWLGISSENIFVAHLVGNWKTLSKTSRSSGNCLAAVTTLLEIGKKQNLRIRKQYVYCFHE